MWASSSALSAERFRASYHADLVPTIRGGGGRKREVGKR